MLLVSITHYYTFITFLFPKERLVFLSPLSLSLSLSTFSLFPLVTEENRERERGMEEEKGAEFNDNVSSQLIIHFLFLIPSSLSHSSNTFIERECVVINEFHPSIFVLLFFFSL